VPKSNPASLVIELALRGAGYCDRSLSSSILVEQEKGLAFDVVQEADEVVFADKFAARQILFKTIGCRSMLHDTRICPAGGEAVVDVRHNSSPRQVGCRHRSKAELPSILKFSIRSIHRHFAREHWHGLALRSLSKCKAVD